jgi:hypothetical protein
MVCAPLVSITSSFRVCSIYRSHEV